MTRSIQALLRATAVLTLAALGLLLLVSPAPGQIRPRSGAGRPSLPGGCPLPIAQWWQQHGRGGRIACGTDPTRPAILLVHGLHQDAKTWTAPSYVEYSYDYRGNPGEQDLGWHDSPGVGIYKVGASSWLYGANRAGWDNSVNWFNFLASRGFTVATWSQPGLTFATAYPTALAAFDSLLSHSRQRSPGRPPAVALIGHSRGGLLIRKVLKERPATGRIRWVMTLHSPHQGSAHGQTPGRVAAETVDLLDCCVPPGPLTDEFKGQLKDLVTEVMRPFTRLVWPDENRELTPDGPLIRSLREGEAAIPGVTYHTFGGTNPRYYKLYMWTFDAQSAIAQPLQNAAHPYRWRIRPVEIGPLSPIMDALRDFVDEVTPNKGDGLVTNTSARLPWSVHTTTQLNHAEVLWDRALQQRVVELIDGPRTRVRGQSPSSGVLMSGPTLGTR